MVDFFNNLYVSIVSRSPFLTKIRFYSVIRALIRVSANIVLPLYFKMTAHKNKNRLINELDLQSPRVIVSFTSFPARIKKVWLVVETILRQSNRPNKIVLWLSNEQFPHLGKLPKRLLDLRERGLEIVLVDGDLRSHKKYYYAMKDYPNDYVVTIDDDVFYGKNMLRELILLEKKYPGTVCTNHAKRININDGQVLPYAEWSVPKGEMEPAFDLVQIGIGGVLYPPKSLNGMVLNKDIFMKHIMYADDIWLYLMANTNNTKICKTKTDLLTSPIINRNNISLTKINVGENMNDEQLNGVLKVLNIKLNHE